MASSPHDSDCNTLLAKHNPTVCACGCGEVFSRAYTGRNRFKRGHYRFVPDQHIVDEATGCWLWTGPVSRAGFGIARNDLGRNEHAHRLYYESLYGHLDDGSIVRQTCGNRLCVNPLHCEVIERSVYQAEIARQKWIEQKAAPDRRIIGALTHHRRMAAR